MQRTYCRNSGDDFSQLQLVKDCGLASGVKPHHQNPHLLLAEEPLEEGGEHVAHGCSGQM